LHAADLKGIIMPSDTQGAGAPAKDPPAEARHPLDDLIAALLFIVIGTGALIIASDYRFGTLHRMGPGLFPIMVGGLLTAIGVALTIQSIVAWRKRGADEAPPILPSFATMRALVFVMASLLAFAVLIRPAGLFIATAVLVFISTRAEPGHGVVRSLILSLALAVVAAAVFVLGIGLPIPLWP